MGREICPDLELIVGQCVAVCCSVLQCVAVCCSVLQLLAVCCKAYWADMPSHRTDLLTGCCSKLQSLAVCCIGTRKTHKTVPFWSPLTLVDKRRLGTQSAKTGCVVNGTHISVLMHIHNFNCKKHEVTWWTWIWVRESLLGSGINMNLGSGIALVVWIRESESNAHQEKTRITMGDA